MKSAVSVVKCNSYTPYLVDGAVRKCVDLLGGITSFIKPKSKVLVKPNLLMAKEPEFGITTHPEVLCAVIKILKEINCHIFVGDSPSVWGRYIENVDDVYRRTGIRRVCEEEGIELVKFDKRRLREKFPLTTWLDESDYLVNVPKFKTHEFTILSGAIKNLFGLVSGIYKTELHKKYFKVDDFSRILVDIFQEAKPALTIVDGIVAMEGDGPGTSGKLRQMGLLLASSDCVALDTVLALIMGIEPQQILTTREAARRGLGTADIKSILIRGERLGDITGESFILPSVPLYRKIPQPIAQILRNLIRYYPRCQHKSCIRCLACIQVCPNKCIIIKSNRIVFKYSKCISCFCCQEVCPAAAIKVKKSILAKIIGL